MVRIWHSHKHKINFLGIPKCGVTTVCKTLDINIDHDWGIEPGYGYKCFTVLRHPIERLGSGWQETLRRGTCSEQTFDGFIRKIEREGFFDEHIMPISYYFVKEWIDYVIMLDGDLQKDLRKFAKFNNVIKGNVSASYTRDISPDALAKLKRIYKKDFQIYGQYR